MPETKTRNYFKATVADAENICISSRGIKDTESKLIGTTMARVFPIIEQLLAGTSIDTSTITITAKVKKQ